MSNFRKYAAGVIISAGVFVTGILWHERESPQISAEDIAHLTSQAYRRYALSKTVTNMPPEDAFLNEPPQGDHLGKTNAISSVMLNASLGQLKTMILPFFMGEGVVPAIHNRPLRARWLQDGWNLNDGDPIISITHDWRKYTYTNYTPSVGLPIGFVVRYWALTNQTVELPAITTLDARYFADNDTSVNFKHDFREGDRKYLPILNYMMPYSGGNWKIRDLPSQPHWWKENVSTNLYEIPEIDFYHDREPGRSAYLKNDVITTNKLNAIVDIMNAVTSAAVFSGFAESSAPPEEQFSTRWAWWSYEYSKAHYRTNEYQFTKSRTDTSTNYPPNDLPDFGGVIADFWGHFRDYMSNPAETVEPGGLMPRCPRLLNVTASASMSQNIHNWQSFEMETDHFNIDVIWGYKKRTTSATQKENFSASGLYYEGSRDFLSRTFFGVSCDWPPDWAYNTSGMVKRVRYYGIFANADYNLFSIDTPGVPSSVPNLEPVYGYEQGNPLRPWKTHYTSFDSQATSVNVNKYRGVDQYSGYILSDFIVDDRLLQSTADDGDRWNFNPPNKRAIPARWRVNILADVAYPTERPRVTIGFPGGVQLPENGIGEKSDYRYEERLSVDARMSAFNNEVTGVQQNWWTLSGNMTFQAYLQLIGLVCIADFDLSLMEDTQTEEYTPPWAEQFKPQKEEEPVE